VENDGMDKEKKLIVIFGDKPVRRAWDEKLEKWWFSVADIIGVLTESVDPTAYWRKLKERLKAEGNETVINCHGFNISMYRFKMACIDLKPLV
jgi:hypothetical protein